MATRIGDTYYFTLDEMHRGGGGGGGGDTYWGDILGSIDNQTDLKTALDSKLTMAQLQALGEDFDFTLTNDTVVTKRMIVLPSEGD